MENHVVALFAGQRHKSVMQDFTLHPTAPATTGSRLQRLLAVMREEIYAKRFDSPAGMAVLAIAAMCCGISASVMGVKGSSMLIAVLVGLPFITTCLFNIKFGVTSAIVLSFFLLGIKRFVADVQLGVLMDVMIAVMFFGLFVKQTVAHNWSFANNPISKIILAWILYNLLQIANPTAESRLAWVYTVRTFAGVMVFYFLLMYAIDSIAFITRLIILWVALTALGAAWGYYQEYVGLLDFELRWVTSVPERYALLFQAGKFRKFSFFSDPLVYGFLLSVTSMLCFILATGPFSRRLKVVLVVLGGAMLWGMLFSGTRAAYVLPPAGLFFYAVLTFRKKIIYANLIVLLAGLVVINIPTSNANIVRLQSAFNPSQDASYQVRVRNQAFIQPFIQKHPLGGGLGSVGEWGKKFSPWSPLAKFPPDSGFIRIAVEQGWLGLLLYCTFLFIVFYVGIKDYFRIRDPLLKTYSLAMLVTLYTLVVANFPQEAIGQYPINLLFFVAIAIINKCRQFDGTTMVKEQVVEKPV